MKLRTVSHAGVTRWTLILALAASVVALLVYGRLIAISITGGSVVMLLNYHLIRLLVSMLMTPGGSSLLSLILLTGKFAIGIGLIGAIFYQVPVAPMAFAFGVSLLLVACVLEACCTGEPVPELNSPQQ